MKIIQSFAQLNIDTNQYVGKQLDGGELYLNLYTFLLSYITLKHWYGHVTIYCNQTAYDNIIKHVPYDDVVIMENHHNSLLYWSYYKVQVMNQMKESFVHVDSDVFLFKDLLRPFIDGRFDGIVQDAIPYEKNFTKGFIDNNIDKFPKNFDKRCYSCGVVGMTMPVLEEYKKTNDWFYNKMVNNEFNAQKENQNIYCGIIEELGFYLTCFNNKFKVHEILPYDEIVKANGNPRNVGDTHGYTHMWFGTKFMKKYIDIIKKKIKKDYGNYYHFVELYDEIIEKKGVKML